MFTMLPSWVRYGVPFVAGVVLTSLYNGYVTRGEHVEQQAEVITNIEKQIVYVEKEVAANDDNTAEYLAELEAARSEADRLRSSAAISRRVCQADAAVSAAIAANSADAEREARASLEAYRASVIGIVEDARRMEAWVDSAHEYINRER